jgi:exosome complex RNA-binding protein Rrp4
MQTLPSQAVVFGPTKTDVNNGVKDIEAFVDYKIKLLSSMKAKTVGILKLSYDKKSIQNLLKSDGEMLYQLEKETGCNIHLKLGKNGWFHIVLTGEGERHVMDAETIVREFFDKHSRTFSVMKSVKLPSVDSEYENILFDFILGRDKASHRKKLETDYKCVLIFDVQNSSLDVYSETQEQLNEALGEVEKVIQRGVEKVAALKFRAKLKLPEDLGGNFVRKMCSGVGSLQSALEQETGCSVLVRGENGRIGFSDSYSPFYVLVCAETEEILVKGLKKINEAIKREGDVYRMESFFQYYAKGRDDTSIDEISNSH